MLNRHQRRKNAKIMWVYLLVFTNKKTKKTDKIRIMFKERQLLSDVAKYSDKKLSKRYPPKEWTLGINLIKKGKK